MAAYEKWQEAISQNIADSSVPGFKKTDIAFSAMPSDLTALPTAGTVVQGSMPSATAQINFSQGQMEHTDSDMDFAIQGKGFFEVKQTNGQMAYTRDGQFHETPEHGLVNKQGLPVIGESGPIVMQPTGGPVSVTQDGMISQGGVQVGKLATMDFADSSKLRRVGGGLFAPADASTPAKAVEHPQVLNNYIEGSNVSSLNEMVNLVSVSRAYEASQKIIQTSDDNEDKAIQSLGNPN